MAASLVLVALSLAPAGHAAPGQAKVTVIQAVPEAVVDISIDGRSVATGASVGEVLGPFELTAGEHEVEFSQADGPNVASTFDVDAGASSDVVLHLPAEVNGEPVVHSYDAPTSSIAPGKARVVLAHTATVAPADVEVNGEVVFSNIANGEFAEADVPAGAHQVALLPSGSTSDPILGPLEVELEARTLSMIYAYGNPRNGSMNVIAHTIELETDDSVVPSRIDTGAAGLVRDPVTPFGSGEGVSDRSWPLTRGALPVVGALALVVAALWRRGRRHTVALTAG
jgi:hypothetical protein